MNHNSKHQNTIRLDQSEMEKPLQSTEFYAKYGFTNEDWERTLHVLSILKNDPFANPDNQRFSGLVSKIFKNARRTNRKEGLSAKKNVNRSIMKDSIASQNALRGTTYYGSETYANRISREDYRRLSVPKNCYCCNQSFDLVHPFYNRLCPSCAELNYENRFKETDLTGYNVIVTGGRVKIGYATALKFLRSGANVMVTTRLPALALKQFHEESGAKDWLDRLHVYGLDLRNLNAVQEFIHHYTEHFSTLDILVNNAAQTIKYPKEYYLPLVKREHQLLDEYKDFANLIANKTDLIDAQHTNLLEMGMKNTDLSEVEINRFGQPVDHRPKNSWNSTLEEIDLTELLEVNLINQISPYHLIKELTPVMKKSDNPKRFIINVTSSEGQFSYTNKSMYHPHTNMTKASLNMLTRTSGQEYARHSIFMNAVDVGWVSTGASETLRKKQFEEGYIPPLDPVDGAARIMLPIIDELKNNEGIAGKLFKNYILEEW